MKTQPSCLFIPTNGISVYWSWIPSYVCIRTDGWKFQSIDKTDFYSRRVLVTRIDVEYGVKERFEYRMKGVLIQSICGNSDSGATKRSIRNRSRSRFIQSQLFTLNKEVKVRRWHYVQVLNSPSQITTFEDEIESFLEKTRSLWMERGNHPAYSKT